MPAHSDEVYPEDEVSATTEVMNACFNEALKAASHTQFETQEEWEDAVTLLTGACMYYQFLDQKICEQTPFAYPIEPDGEAGEFTHSF